MIWCSLFRPYTSCNSNETHALGEDALHAMDAVPALVERGQGARACYDLRLIRNFLLPHVDGPLRDGAVRQPGRAQTR